METPDVYSINFTPYKLRVCKWAPNEKSIFISELKQNIEICQFDTNIWISIKIELDHDEHIDIKREGERYW